LNKIRHAPVAADHAEQAGLDRMASAGLVVDSDIEPPRLGRERLTDSRFDGPRQGARGPRRSKAHPGDRTVSRPNYFERLDAVVFTAFLNYLS
jgi:hypothetical protein